MNKHRKSYLSLCTLAALSSYTLPLQALAMQQERSEEDEEAIEKITVVGSNIRGGASCRPTPGNYPRFR